MQDRSLQKLRYQTSVHHRQNLRSHLDQSLIDKLQISPTPSLNYQKAYQQLYQDELQKSVMLHDQKKDIEKTKKNYDTLVAGQHMKIFRNEQPFKQTTNAINIHNLNYKDVPYLNYDLLKQTKALDHTLKNYDGGQGFYKNHDLHQINQRNQLQNMRKTLLQQIWQKDQQKQQQYNSRVNQQNAIQTRQQIQRNYQSQINMNNNLEKQRHRDVIVTQMNEQRVKRGRRSIFNYNNVARHNPITNPIQYHIDNPYILKQIQTGQQQGQGQFGVGSSNRDDRNRNYSNRLYY